MKNLFGRDKVEEVIERLKEREPPEGYYVAFSGGKDSVVLLDLVRKSGVKHEVHYHNTTCDPPDVYRFIKENYPDVKIDQPAKTMWQLIRQKGLPRRKSDGKRGGRWCCYYLKEGVRNPMFGDKKRIVVTGIRREESQARANRTDWELPKKNKRKIAMFLHPIFDWTLIDIWEYIDGNNLPYLTLYDHFLDRVGCIICPMQSLPRKIASKRRWPKYWDAMYRAGRRWFYSKGYDHNGKSIMKDWDDYWNHWFYETPMKDPDQTVMFE